MTEAKATTGASVASSETKKSVKRAGASSTRTADKRPPLSGLAIALIVIALLLGGGLGALLMRQRYKANDVVIVVNGTIINKDTLYRRMEQATGNKVIQEIVDEELKIQFAKKTGVYPDAKQLEDTYQKANKQAGFDTYLKTSGLSPDDIKRGLLIGMINKAMISKDISVSKEEVQQYYRENVNKNNLAGRFYSPETVQIAVIVTKTESKIKKAYAALRDGATFGTVAKQFSEDASKNQSGVMPLVQRGRTAASKIAGLEETVFSMKIGQRLEPRSFGGVWWIIQCLDKQPEKIQPFSEVEKDCEEGARAVKGAAKNGQKVAEEYRNFVKQATIQSFWPQFRVNVK